MDNLTNCPAVKRASAAAGKMWIRMKMWKSREKAAFTRRVFHMGKPACSKWMMWMMLISRSGEQICPDLIDISGAYSYHQIILSAICQKVFFDLLKCRQEDTVPAQAEDLLPEVL